MERAQRYVEAVDAAHVFPCAGPPAFLDDPLFALNDVDRDPANIFPDQNGANLAITKLSADGKALVAAEGKPPGFSSKSRITGNQLFCSLSRVVD